jgi:hypothetical protein
MMNPLPPDAPGFTRRYLNLVGPASVPRRFRRPTISSGQKNACWRLSHRHSFRIKRSARQMDGWETRRKQVAGNDRCIVRLGRASVIKGFDLDTTFFTDNWKWIGSTTLAASGQISDPWPISDSILSSTAVFLGYVCGVS